MTSGATIKALTEVRAAIQSIDGTIHPSVAVGALVVMIRVFGVQTTRTSVETKAAIVALIDAMAAEANDG